MTLKGQSEHLENGASCPSTIVGEQIPPSLFAVKSQSVEAALMTEQMARVNLFCSVRQQTGQSGVGETFTG